MKNAEQLYSLVSTAVSAFTTNQEVWTGVDGNSIFRNTFFTLKGEEDRRIS